MKRVMLIVLLLINFTFSSLVYGQEYGVGVCIGEPAGLTAKYWLSQDDAVSGILAFSFGQANIIDLNLDYHRYLRNLVTIENISIPVYYGVGAKVALGENAGVGLRLPVGTDYRFENVPLNAFLEITPVVFIIPSTDLGFNGSLGLRYLF